jgi:hypothetical protein
MNLSKVALSKVVPLRIGEKKQPRFVFLDLNMAYIDGGPRSKYLLEQPLPIRVPNTLLFKWIIDEPI